MIKTKEKKMNTININTFNSAFKDYPTLSVDEIWELNEKKN